MEGGRSPIYLNLWLYFGNYTPNREIIKAKCGKYLVLSGKEVFELGCQGSHAK